MWPNNLLHPIILIENVSYNYRMTFHTIATQQTTIEILCSRLFWQVKNAAIWVVGMGVGNDGIFQHLTLIWDNIGRNLEQSSTFLVFKITEIHLWAFHSVINRIYILFPHVVNRSPNININYIFLNVKIITKRKKPYQILTLVEQNKRTAIV